MILAQDNDPRHVLAQTNRQYLAANAMASKVIRPKPNWAYLGLVETTCEVATTTTDSTGSWAEYSSNLEQKTQKTIRGYFIHEEALPSRN